MKRVFVLLLACLALFLSGCSANVPEDNFLSVKPWAPYAAQALGEEICEYRVSRYLGTQEDGTLITLPSSRLIYTLKEGYSYDLAADKEIADPDSTLLKAQLNVSYINSDEVVNGLRGQTENIVSYCVFDRYNLAPKLSYRFADTVEAGFELTLDYLSGKATLKDGGGQSTLNIKSGGYDNESLYYVVRALNTITEGGTAKLSLVLAYDDFKYENKNVKSREIIQSTAADLVNVALEPSVYRQFFSTTPVNEEDYVIGCYETSVRLNTTKSGPAVKLFFAKQPTRIASAEINSVSYETKNVLVRFEHTLYGYLSGPLNLDYTQVFELVKYTNK